MEQSRNKVFVWCGKTRRLITKQNGSMHPRRILRFDYESACSFHPRDPRLLYPLTDERWIWACRYKAVTSRKVRARSSPWICERFSDCVSDSSNNTVTTRCPVFSASVFESVYASLRNANLLLSPAKGGAQEGRQTLNIERSAVRETDWRFEWNSEWGWCVDAYYSVRQ